MQIVRTSLGFSVYNTEDRLIYRTLSSFQEAENWRNEAKFYEDEKSNKR